MGNYKIKINVGIYDSSDISNGIVVATEEEMSESEAESIDAVEKALLNVNKKVLVESIALHLEEISKKKASIREMKLEEKYLRMRIGTV
jgi:hypothetical protein